MKKKVCIEFSEEAMSIICDKCLDPEAFVTSCINHGLSEISDYTDYFEIDYELDMEKPKHMPVRMKEKIIRNIVKEVQDEHDGNAPKNIVIEEILKTGMTIDQAELLIDRCKRIGSIFEPEKSLLRIA